MISIPRAKKLELEILMVGNQVMGAAEVATLKASDHSQVDPDTRTGATSPIDSQSLNIQSFGRKAVENSAPEVKGDSAGVKIEGEGL